MRMFWPELTTSKCFLKVKGFELGSGWDKWWVRHLVLMVKVRVKG